MRAVCGSDVLLSCRWLTRRRPLFLASAGQGMAVFGVCWRMKLPVARRAGGALPPRRSRCSRSPGARGCAPLPPDPYPRQAELAGFCALRARAALRADVSLLAHGSTRLCCAGACSDPTCARWWRAPSAPLAWLAAPGARGCEPLPPDPYPRQAEFAGFCALRARAALRAGCFCARARSHPHVCAGARSHPPARSHPASSYHARMFFRRCVSRSQNCRAASALSPRRLM